MAPASFTPSEDADAAERHHPAVLGDLRQPGRCHKDGWWACAKLDRIPWDASPSTLARFAPGQYDPDHDKWELYYLPMTSPRPTDPGPRSTLEKLQGVLHGPVLWRRLRE